tara:strand:+ start:169 stop:702 length:534 start_codon:yes stop_codon:yes gene_type:complete
MTDYLLKTKRLGLRNWTQSDIAPFVAMGKDPEVMRYFPSVLTKQESVAFIERIQEHFILHGFCYFAVDVLETGEFIGFTGMLHQNFSSPYTPNVDLGWRLKKSAWSQGYATEAANACIEAAFTTFGLAKVVAFAPSSNVASQRIMEKIGMRYLGDFQHPKLRDDPRFSHCVAFGKSR